MTDRTDPAAPLPAAGLHHLARRDYAAAILHALHARWQVVPIDLAGCSGKRELLAILARDLDFPAHFGHNWDALADSLSELPVTPERPFLLACSGSEAFAQRHPQEAATLLDIFAEACRWHAARGGLLAVLLLAEPATAARG